MCRNRWRLHRLLRRAGRFFGAAMALSTGRGSRIPWPGDGREDGYALQLLNPRGAGAGPGRLR